MSKITQEELMKRLHYNPNTGEFRWRYSVAKRIKPGDLAGRYNTQNYLDIAINQVRYKAHRLAWLYMTGDWPKNEIDHINCDPSDNRWCNLRLCDRYGNTRNVGLRKDNTSGFKGVSWNKKTQQWQSHVTKNGQMYSSMHTYYWQAIRATIRKREQLHGEYHRHR